MPSWTNLPRRPSRSPKSEVPSAKTASNVIVLPAAPAQNSEPAPSPRMEVLLPNPMTAKDAPARPSPTQTENPLKHWDRRKVLFLVAGVCILLAIAIGLRLRERVRKSLRH